MVSHQKHTILDDDDGPVGINALSPSSDAVLLSPVMKFYSPIGSPVVSHFLSDHMSIFKDNRENHVNVGKTESLSPNTDRRNHKDSLVKEFDNFNLSQSPYNDMLSSPTKIVTFPKRPNPLIKQNSLPPLFKINSKSESHYGSNQFHSLLRNKHGSEDSIYSVSNNNKMNNVSDDEWIDQFGMEMDQTKSFSISGSSSPRPFYQDVQQPSNTSPSKSPVPPLTKINRPLEQYRSLSNNNSPRGNSPNGSIKHSSRIISVQNAYMYDDEDLIKHQFDNYEVRSVRKLGNVLLISFYDVRESLRAIQDLFGKVIGGIPLELSFFLLRDFSCQEEYNQGTLVIFNLDPNIDNSELKRIFGAYGKIREIRESPNKKHKFVEFFDVRDAENAMHNLNKTEIYGRRIKIEASRPGGGNKQDNGRERKDYHVVNKAMSTSMPSRNSLSSHFNKESELYTERKSLSPRFEIKSRNENKAWNFQESPNKKDEFTYSQFTGFLESSEVAKYDINLENIRNKNDVRTTLMIKNIPNKYDQDMLLNAINIRHNGTYDFFYLPIDFKNRCNVGYAFINFIDPLSIPTFFEEFNSKKWERFNSEKVCQIRYARIQGKDTMVEHFKNSSLMFEDPKCRPLIFKSDGLGIPQPFPVGPYVKPRRKKK